MILIPHDKRCFLIIVCFSAVLLALGHTPEILSGELPETPWLPPGLEGGDVDIDLQDGSLGFSYPLPLPNAPNGTSPVVTLTYNSQSGGDGLTGVGWALPLWSVERIGRTGGQPAFDNTDRYSLALPVGGGRLLLASNPQGLHTEYEQHLRIQESKARTPTGEPCEYIVTDKLGTTYRLGGRPFLADTTANGCGSLSRVGLMHPSSPTKPALWLLTSINDRFGNSIQFKYANSQPHEWDYPRLMEINWGGNTSADSPATYRLEFVWEPRPFVEHSVQSGIVLRFAYRLLATRLSALHPNGSSIAIRDWNFSYTQLADSRRSFLATIQVKDPITNSVLPPTSFATDTPTPEPLVRWSESNATNTKLGSFGHAFGIPDGLYQRKMSFKRKMNIGLDSVNTVLPSPIKYGGMAAKLAFNYFYRPKVSFWTSRETWGLTDMTGDGLPDRLITKRRPGSGLQPDCIFVAANTGSGFGDWKYWGDRGCGRYLHSLNAVEGDDGFPVESHITQTMLDFNGDGIADIVRCDGNAWIVSFNDGNSFNRTGIWEGVPCQKKGSRGRSISLGYSTYGDEHAIPMDLNGDGWLDFVECAGEELIGGVRTKCRAYINLGKNDGSADFRKVNFNSSGPLLRARRNSDSRWITTSMMVDINGDGLPDKIFQERTKTECINYNPCPRKPWYVYLNRGGQLDSVPRLWPGVEDPIASEWMSGENSSEDAGLVDFNGDGLPDYFSPDSRICSDTRIRGSVAFNTGGGFAPAACVELDALQRIIRDDKNTITYEQQLFDVDGDGIVEKVERSGSKGEWIISQLVATRNVQVVSGVPYSNLVRRITYPLGGETLISYLSSSKSARNTRFPAVVPLVVSLTNRAKSMWDPNEVHKTIFSYGDGKLYRSWDLMLSLGFGWAKSLDLTSNAYQRIIFNQYQHGAPGIVVPSNVGTLREEEFGQQIGSTEHKLRTLVQTHQIDLDPPYYTPLVLASTADYNYSTTPVSARTNSVIYAYDAYGNITQRTNTGDPEIDGDTSEYVVDFHYDTKRWILGLPKRARIYDTFDGTSLLRNETRYYYDGRNSLTVLPSKGFVSRVTSGDPDNTITPDIPDDWTTVFYNHILHTNLEVGRCDESAPKVYQEDLYGRLTNVMGPGCNRQTIAYDTQYPDLVRAIIDGDRPLTTRYAYYGVGGESVSGGVFGAIKWVQEANGEGKPNSAEYRTAFKYDGFGRLTEFTRPYDDWTEKFLYSGSSATFWVKRLQRAPSRPALLTRDSRIDFDGYGRPMLGSYRNETGYSYVKMLHDSRGRVRSLSLPSNAPIPDSRLTIFGYDALGRPTTINRPDGKGPRISTTRYDGWQITVTGARAYETADKENNGSFRTVLSTLNARKIEVRSGQTITRYTSDVFGNVVSIDIVVPRPCSLCTLSQLSNEDIIYTISARYDSLGRLRSVNHPDVGTITYDLDQSGNILLQKTPRGTIRYGGYDSLNRVGWKSLDGDEVAEITYSYDDPLVNGLGRLTRTAGPDGAEVSYSYDLRGRLEVETLKATTIPPQGSLSATYGYDSADRIVILRANRLQVTYSYNPHGKVEAIHGGSITRLSPIVSDVDYGPGGQVISIKYANGFVARFDYHRNNDSLMSMTIMRDTEPIQEFTYDYDDAGNLIRQSENFPSSTVNHFTYDSLDRLTQKSSKVGQSMKILESYAYDEKHNMTSKNGRSYYYDQRQTTCASNESRGGPMAISHAESVGDFCYDLSGNLVRGAGRSYQWTADDMPRHIVDSLRGSETWFYYTADRIRYRKIEQDSNGTLTSSWYGPSRFLRKRTGESEHLHDRLPVFLQGSRIAEVDGMGRILSFHFDNLGSTSIVSNSAGEILERLSYDGFGAIFEDSAPALSHHKYTGQEVDSGTKLYNFGSRLYDSDFGRFVSPDNVIPTPGDPWSLNSYGYALNNPMRYADPSGNEVEEATHVVAGEIIEEGSVYGSQGLLHFAEGSGELVIEGMIWQNPEDAFTAYIAAEIPPSVAYDMNLPYLTSTQLADLALSLGYIPRNRNELGLMSGPNGRAANALGRASVSIASMALPIPIKIPGLASLPKFKTIGTITNLYKNLRFVRTAYVDAVKALGKAVPEGTSPLSVEQMARRLVMARNHLKVEARESMPWVLRHATNVWDRARSADALLKQKNPLEVIDSATRTNPIVDRVLLP